LNVFLGCLGPKYLTTFVASSAQTRTLNEKFVSILFAYLLFFNLDPVFLNFNLELLQISVFFLSNNLKKLREN
jgi:hypothetical protein